MLDRPVLKALSVLNEGARQHHFTLPDDLTAAGTWAAVLRAHEYAAVAAKRDGPHGEDAVEAAADPLGATIRPGDAAPDAIEAATDAVLADEATYERLEARQQVLTVAADVAERAFLRAAQRALPRIVAEHLAPALAVTLNQVRAASKALGAVGPTREAMYGQPKAITTAYEQLEAAVTRYGAIRGAQAAVWVLGYVPRSFKVEDSEGRRREGADLEGECALASDAFYGVWPDRGGLSGFRPVPPPWPDEQPGQLAWQVAHGVPLWCPTLEQQNAAVQALHAKLRDEYEEAAAKARRRGGAHSRTAAAG